MHWHGSPPPARRIARPGGRVVRVRSPVSHRATRPPGLAARRRETRRLARLDEAPGKTREARAVTGPGPRTREETARLGQPGLPDVRVGVHPLLRRVVVAQLVLG